MQTGLPLCTAAPAGLAPIGGVEKSAIARHNNFGGTAVTDKRVRECWHYLEWSKPARRRIEAIGSNRRVELARDIREGAR